MYQSVLVPLDGSPLAEQALAPAAAIARKAGARLILVRVMPEVGATTYMPYVGDEMLAALRELYMRDRAAAHEYLATLATHLVESAGLRPQTAVLDGRPAGAICEHAVETGADLIVMTTHGRAGFSRAWLGSVADGVVRHACVAVLLLRPTEERDGGLPASFERVLIPLDGSPQAQAILPHARALGSLFNARYSLMTVVTPLNLPVQIGPNRFPAPIVAATAEDVRVERAKIRIGETADRLRHECDGADVAKTVLVDENVAGAILEQAKRERADVIALTTFGRGPVRLLFGSVADKVIRGTTGAVLLFRPAPD